MSDITVDLDPRTAYLESLADKAEVHGIDVSAWQGAPDWSVAQVRIDFAMLRCAHGKNRDTSYDYNAAECRRLGIPFGIYIYIKPDKNMATQIETLEACYDDYVPPLGVWLDCETDGGLDKAALENYLTKFTAKCDERFGIDRVGIYTRASWWDFELPRMDWPKRHRLWVAHYNDYIDNPDIPDDWGEVNNPRTWSFWQHTDKGHGADYGIDPYVSRSVDLNRFNGTYVDFITAFDLDAKPLPPPPPPDPDPEPLPVTVRTTASWLNVRTEPTVTPVTRIGSVPNGTIFDVAYHDGEWVGVVCWVHSDWVESVA